jgi:hypothetical protein
VSTAHLVSERDGQHWRSPPHLELGGRETSTNEACVNVCACTIGMRREQVWTTGEFSIIDLDRRSRGSTTQLHTSLAMDFTTNYYDSFSTVSRANEPVQRID